MGDDITDRRSSIIAALWLFEKKSTAMKKTCTFFNSIIAIHYNLQVANIMIKTVFCISWPVARFCLIHRFNYLHHQYQA